MLDRDDGDCQSASGFICHRESSSTRLGSRSAGLSLSDIGLNCPGFVVDELPPFTLPA